jgi:hypothetical protein
MLMSYRTINIFISHPFEPKNEAYNLESFRSNIRLLISEAENNVRKEYRDFELEKIFQFNDFESPLSSQVESSIRKSHFAIVDITENKPNIFYEYGLLYALGIPVLMTKSSKVKDFPIPSDIKDKSKLVIMYDDFADLINNCKENVANIFKKLLHDDSFYIIYLNWIWFPNDVSTIHVITSTESEPREEFATPGFDNYMELEVLGDKDSLLKVMFFLNRNYPKAELPMYAAKDFKNTFQANMVVIGGPGDEGGDENHVCKLMMEKISSKISYSEDCEELLYNGQKFSAVRRNEKIAKDFGYFARFPNPFNSRNTVVLINGIHTSGVVGASMAFSDHPSAQENIRKLLYKLKLDDFHQASFECFFSVEIIGQEVVCPKISEEYIFPISYNQ